MSAMERRSLLAGLAALAAAAVVLELGLTRVAAVVLGTEASSGVAALALVAGAIGAFAAARSSLVDGPGPSPARQAEAAAALAVIGIIVTLDVSASKLGTLGAEMTGLGGRSLSEALVLALSVALPFAFSGAATALALRRASGVLGRASFALFAGTAVGLIAGVLCVRAGAPRASLVAAVVFSLAAAAFAAASPPSAEKMASPAGSRPAERRTTDVSFAATAVLGSLVLLAGDVGAPWLKLRVARLGLPEKAEMQRWSERGLLSADRPRGGVSVVRIDGVARGAAVDGRGSPPPEPEDLAFAFAPARGPVLLLDPVGSGRILRAALKAGQKELDYVVGDAALADALASGELKAFGTALYGDERVRTRIGDGRAELRSSPGGLHLVVISAAHPTELSPLAWPMAGAAASLADASLSTREAFTEALARLAEDGAVVVRTPPDPERAAVTMLAALRLKGAAAPSAHLFACGAPGSAALLAKKTPLAPEELHVLRAHCRQSKLVELLAPDKPRELLARRLSGELVGPAASTLAKPAASALAPTSTNVVGPTPEPSSPARLLTFQDIPTDDRPLLGALASSPAMRLAVATAFAALAGFLAAALLVRARARAVEDSVAARAGLATGLLGIGVAALEMLLSRHLSAALGHPVYALLLVVAVLSVGLGTGALLSERLAPESVAVRASRLALVGSLFVLLCGVALGPLARAVSGQGIAARVLASLLVVASVSLPVGALLPLLLGLASRGRPSGAALAFGLHLLGQLVALTVGSVLAAQVGFLSLSALAAAALAAIVPLVSGRAEPAPVVPPRQREDVLDAP